MEETAKEKLFTREQFIKNDDFSDYRDLICALMAEDEKCSVKALNKRITAFLSRKTH